jgi:hypothetical protein
MPGCLGLDGMWQLTGFFLGWLGEPGRGMALSTGEVKFKRWPCAHFRPGAFQNGRGRSQRRCCCQRPTRSVVVAADAVAAHVPR